MLKNHDWILTTIAVLLSIVGIFTLISTNIAKDGTIQLDGTVSRQIMFIVVGFILYFLISLLDYRYLLFKQVTVPIYIFIIALLLYVLIAGPVINNVRRWMVVGTVQIQPSEFAKLGVVIITAAILTMKSRFNDLVLALISFLFLLPVLVLIYLEPHGSMTVMTFIIWAFLVFTSIRDQRRSILLLVIGSLVGAGIFLYIIAGNFLGILFIISAIIFTIFAYYSGEDRKFLPLLALLIGILAGISGIFGWNDVLRDYQRDRIETFVSAENADDDKKFNVEQSKVAIGSGGLFGKGFGSGTQSRLQYLPEHHTDFIFAAYAEQFGLVGSFFLLTLFALLIMRILLFSMKTVEYDQFGGLLLLGVAVMLLLGIFINIGTNTGIIPATGIPLPLISAGGSNVILTFISLGLVQSIIRYSDEDRYEEGSFIDNEELLI